MDVYRCDEGNYEDREIQPEPTAEDCAGDGLKDLGLRGLIMLVDQLEESQRCQVAGDTEKDMCGKSGIEIS